ncbi:DUF4377 domain-containing protein [Pedobacter arcticus]|uniref:DUF4377 domain-containing protein n=1 Tax=Pedobacter arcticus TaxID=752140 RepID=UPI00047496F6|nr:DUF4377 domain-containing protein [Pedobacter arcticus]
MKKLSLFLSIAVISVLLLSCTKNQGDKEKIVEMTIYPETGHGASIMSDIWTEPLVFSDSDDPQKSNLSSIIIENFDFDYERGYEYKYKVKKIWLKNPPQDVSSIKYIFIKQLSKTKVIITDSEKNIQLLVSPETVKFTPKFPKELESDGSLKIYNALRVNEVNTNNWMALKTIEGFDFEAGFTYTLNVKKTTTAEPYAVKYVLVSVLSKEKKN